MTTPFTDYILPISGTDFVRYMAFFSILADFDIKPERIYCASGGCLASYIAMMSSFTKQIEQWDINSNMIIEQSSPLKLRTMTYIMSGYLYRRPNMQEYIRKAFVPAKIRDVEIISGYYQTEQKKVVISTNFTEGTSSLSATERQKLQRWNTDLLYGPEDVNELMTHVCSTIQRTSNIPYLLQSDDNNSIDFGVIAPSPRTLLNINPNRSIYFCPINLQEDKNSSLYETIFYRTIINDVITIENQFTSRQDFNDAATALAFALSKSQRALVMYTVSDIVIPITSFSKIDVAFGMRNAKRLMRYIVFYS